MANKNPKRENLIPNSQRTPKELKEMTSKAGKKSGQVRREKKTFKQLIETMMEMDIERFTTNEEVLEQLANINPELAQKADVKSVITARLLDKALKGDLYAMGMVRDQIGEQITQKVDTTATNLNIEAPNINKAKELKKMLDEEDEK